MSYDVYGVCDHCGASMFDWNYTSNCAQMWREAGCDIAEFHDKPASALASALGDALTAMEANPDKFRAMNPSNGWGDFDRLFVQLRILRRKLLENPNTKVRVSR